MTSTQLVRFRTLGIICTRTPVAINTLGTNGFYTAVAPLEKSFQLYNMENLHLIFASKEISSKHGISSVAAHNEFTLASAGAKVFVYKRADVVGVLSLPHEEEEGDDGQLRIFKLLILGELVLAAASDNTIRIWNWDTREYIKTLSFDAQFNLTAILHPSTYVNKILVASTDGRMQLWNFATLSLIYEFSGLSSSITSLEQAPAIDVVAIGLQDGRILLKNLKTNTNIRHFHHDGQCPVTAISFRNDEGSDSAMMATGGADGGVFIWDIEKGRMIVKVAAGENAGDAHQEAVHTLEFLAGQPVLVSASGDNSIKEWIFDAENGHPRLWKSRTGHRDPPNRVRFIGPEPTTIITSGSDGSLRKYSTIQDQRNLEFSRKNANAKKFGASNEEGIPNPIIHFDACESGNDWDDVVTVEANNQLVKTWKLKRGAIGNHELSTSDKSPAKIASISPCGNFAFVGSTLGGIDMYNMQSGRLKKSFPKNQLHSKAIVGLAVDSLSSILVSASLDGTLKVWSIKTSTLTHTIKFPVPASAICFHKDSNIVAVACDDLCLRIVDVEVGRIVRELWGHQNRILDLALSPDSRWLVSSGLEGSVKLWDIPSSSLIGSLKVDPATSVSFSVDGNYIASSHVNNRGVVLWANTTLFDIASSSIPEELLNVPDQEDMLITGKEDEGEEGDDVNHDLIRLSTLPLSRVQLLLNLESIQKRKRPTEKVEKPDSVPFFLGALSSTTSDMSFKAADFTQVAANTDVSRNTLLDFNDSTADWHGKVEFLERLAEMSPSALDLEIRSFATSDFGPFLDLLLNNTSSSNYEFLQCVLNIFVEAHGSDVIGMPKHIREKLTALKSKTEESWRTLEDLFHSNLAILDHLRS
ncbi:quinon protein alcohol dehydrogenase-like superfamily [Chytriomyces sp. MP71]|nr:quinon protein alcohol dehydrogenase-like superfamily [Chytriomyces sp. MP71]